ncbi:DNA cytosine methyltransferase [Hutsoniella sourekii]|uniref:DNA cytosine methyltransferase n=1 Tax=Hutsoniella sourekii TaxID=87650 RepID=UPI0004BB3DC1|nr:DNA cytosine methyltransferase [Hutsoniella sourekii]
MSNSNGLNVLDLFCGAGGLSRGFMDAGFNIVLGVDFDDNALKTFKENHNGAEAMKLDLFNHENIHCIKENLDSRNLKIDVLVGGPPCQGFSLAGPREENDSRNTLYTAMVKTAGLLKPNVVILENVPGLLTLFDGKAARRIHEDFEEVGYNMKSKILYGPEFGIPQIRKRVFFVGVREGYEFEFPTPIITKEEDFITTKDAISDLPSRENDIGKNIDEYENKPQTDYQRKIRNNSKVLYNHVGANHIEKTVKLISMVPEGKNYKSLPEEYSEQFKYNEALTRYHSNKPSLTINTGHRSHFHYRYNRIPTVRESARLQSFTDDFIFFGPKTEQYKLVGNAVPPIWGYHLGTQVEKTLQEVKLQDE